MAESEHVQRDIGAIRTRLDQIESMQRLIVAASKDVRDHVRDVLSKRENAAEIVFHLSNGPLLQEDLMARVTKSRATVSKVLTYLHDAGLLMRDSDPDDPRKVRWGLNDLETTVNIKRVARELVIARTQAPNRRGSNGAS